MKKRILIFFILIFAFFSLASCNKWKTIEGSGDFVTKEFADFEASTLTISNIQVTSNKVILPVTLYMEDADEPKVSLVGQENILNDINVETSFEDLLITGSSRTNYETEYLRIYIYGYKFSFIHLKLTTAYVGNECLADNTTINLEAASRFTLSNFNGKKLDISCSSSSELILDSINLSKLSARLATGSSLIGKKIKAEKFDFDFATSSSISLNESICTDGAISLSGASNMEIRGSATSLDLNLSSSSLFTGNEFYTDNVTIGSISGESTAYIYVNKTINVITATGASRVVYFGEPIVTEGLISSHSSIEKGE